VADGVALDVGPDGGGGGGGGGKLDRAVIPGGKTPARGPRPGADAGLTR